MTVPAWLDSTIAEFGRSSGLDSLAFDSAGAVALRFENGFSLRMEYTGKELLMAVAMPGNVDLKRLLSVSDPRARYGFRLRAGVMPKRQEPFIAVKFAERDVTLPQLNAAFATLWRLAREIGGGE